MLCVMRVTGERIRGLNALMGRFISKRIFLVCESCGQAADLRAECRQLRDFPKDPELNLCPYLPSVIKSLAV